MGQNLSGEDWELRSLTIHKEKGEWAVVSGTPTGKPGPVGRARQARGHRPASRPMATRGQRVQKEFNLPAIARQELPQGSEKKKECELPGEHEEGVEQRKTRASPPRGPLLLFVTSPVPVGNQGCTENGPLPWPVWLRGYRVRLQTDQSWLQLQSRQENGPLPGSRELTDEGSHVSLLADVREQARAPEAFTCLLQSPRRPPLHWGPHAKPGPWRPHSPPAAGLGVCGEMPKTQELQQLLGHIPVQVQDALERSTGDTRQTQPSAN